MIHNSITQGSIEPLIVDLDDVLENLTTLVGSSCQYDVYTHGGTLKLLNQAAVIDTPDFPMRAICQINTNSGGLWATGKYKLYLHFAASPDTPRVGPLEFEVNP